MSKTIDYIVQILSVIPRLVCNHIPNRLVFEFDKFNFCQFFANFNDVTPYEKFEKWRKMDFGKTPGL